MSEAAGPLNLQENDEEGPTGTARQLQALNMSTAAGPYFLSTVFAERFPGCGLLETKSGSFDFNRYADSHSEICQVQLNADCHPEEVISWHGSHYPPSVSTPNGWYKVRWKEHALDVICATWKGQFCDEHHYWIVAPSQQIATDFYRDVCSWNDDVHHEIWVFDEGFWHKNRELYNSIQAANFDNLTLPPALRAELRNDFSQFFSSREVYEAHGIPWKRGVLFLGPPGNGKTHTLKALLNWLGQTCLYVKSFKSRHDIEHSNIHKVFQRARQTTPCILVFEDLDSLLNAANRSFFLNELDGFAQNNGIVTVATTNYPERLDASILDRPSRFDRKYHFVLPAAAERIAYLEHWNNSARAELKLSPDGMHSVVEETDRFSYAYLKELTLSAMMRWIASSQPGSMDQIFRQQIEVLRQQMKTLTNEDGIPSIPPDSEDEEMED